LKHTIQDHPDYLKNASVFIEYSGIGTFTSAYEDERFCVYESSDKMEKSMPHLLLPYLNLVSLVTFLKESKNSKNVKLEMILLQSAFYRSIGYVNETFHSQNTKTLFAERVNNLVSEGGIRNDMLESAQKKAIIGAKLERLKIESEPLLTFQQMEKSTLAAIQEIVTKNGGMLFLFEMPLHSIQQETFSSAKACKNKAVFEEWLKTRGISIVAIKEFNYSDADFPDTWHLGKTRRDEFTRLLYTSITKSNISKGLVKEK